MVNYTANHRLISAFFNLLYLALFGLALIGFTLRSGKTSMTNEDQRIMTKE